LLAPIMSARLDLAVTKKCDGVEPDNVRKEKSEERYTLILFFSLRSMGTLRTQVSPSPPLSRSRTTSGLRLKRTTEVSLLV
jgi:hypothetical protein